MESGNLRCVKESSGYTGIPVGALYRLARLGMIPHRWEGHQIRFLQNDLDDYMMRCSDDDRRGFLG